ncbi:MAG: DUF3466 family protein [Gammaproteobacteria bacterium]|nr:DUF3466 family protein [Gammaproteobacteria bacterium]
MQKVSLLTASVLALMPLSSVVAKSLPAAYDIVDLGAFETDSGDAVSDGAKTSFGYAINNDNSAVGASSAPHTYTIEREVNGVIVVEEVTFNMLQSIYFPDLNRTITPPERGLGIGAITNGNFATTINDETNGDGLIGGYGYDTIELESFDVDDSCASLGTNESEIRSAYTFDIADNLFKLTPNVYAGQALGSEIEYTSSVFLDSIDGYMVGYVERITEKDDCGNISRVARRGLIYNTDTDTISILPSYETGEYETSAISTVRGINSAGTIVGITNRLDDTDESRRSVAYYGDVGSDTLNLVTGLTGATASYFWDVNDSELMVGASNSESNLSNFVAFYYDNATEQVFEIGYLNDQIPSSEALAVNNDNLIVGVSRASISPSSYRPFIYDADATDAQPIDLNNLIDCDAGWVLSEVRAINDNGWIIGTGTVKVVDNEGKVGAEVRAFALQPRSTPANQTCEVVDDTNSSGGLSWFAALLLPLAGLRRRRSH